MRKSVVRDSIIDYVLELEREDFHREWAPENLKGISLSAAYKLSSNHVFMLAVIASYGMNEYRKSVKDRWASSLRRSAPTSRSICLMP